MDYNTSLAPLNQIPFSENISQGLDFRILVRSYLMYRLGIIKEFIYHVNMDL